jgi:D-glycero-alpha-D-manno-heptose 1-phosphate guanylyltransferase
VSEAIGGGTVRLGDRFEEARYGDGEAGRDRGGRKERAGVCDGVNDPFADEVKKSAVCPKDRERLPPAVILAGGLGTRLRSAYSAGPKSMAPVGGRPFLDYLLQWLSSEGVEDVILCVGYKRSHIRRFVGGGRKWGLRVRYSVEKKLLGTGGAVKKAGRLIPGNRLLVVNGDTFVYVRLGELMEFHQSRKAVATLTAVKIADSARYGSLRMDDRARVAAFLEKSGIDESKRSKTQKRLINGGVYVFEKTVLKTIRTRKTTSLEKEVFPSLVANKRLHGFKCEAYFLDIGVPKDLRRAQSELPQRIRVSHPR